jgi:hypothetical protein
MLKRIILSLSFLSIVGATAPSFAQADLIELMRSDLRTQKKAILTQAMQLTEAQSEAFWPVYNEYESELMKLNDTRLTLIKDYASNYSTMTDAVAKDLVSRSFKWQEGNTKLLKKYYGKMAKALSPIVAARWVQAEHAINSMIDVQVASEIPLIQ